MAEIAASTTTITACIGNDFLNGLCVRTAKVVICTFQCSFVSKVTLSMCAVTHIYTHTYTRPGRLVSVCKIFSSNLFFFFFFCFFGVEKRTGSIGMPNMEDTIMYTLEIDLNKMYTVCAFLLGPLLCRTQKRHFLVSRSHSRPIRRKDSRNVFSVYCRTEKL